MFSTLYGKDKKGNFKVWSIAVVKQDTKSIIIIKHGLENGKSIEKVIEIAQGKNLGKLNATTHYTQAQKEAKSRWEYKIEEGYSVSKETISPKILPMLAKDFVKAKHSIKYPCSVQPKLDGIRCLYDSGANTMYSRTGKEFRFFDHLNYSLSTKIPDNFILDGELYSHTIPFHVFGGLLNKKKLTVADSAELLKVNYVVYDIITPNSPDMPFQDRLKLLKALFKELNLQIVKNPNDIHNDGKVCLLVTESCDSEICVAEKHTEYTKLGYEGIIIRNNSGVYMNNYRSKDLQKFKTFMDAEFKVIGFKESEGLVIWVCEIEGPSPRETFDVVPKTTHAERKKLYKEGNKYIGKMLTVRFQEYIGDSGKVPRFGIGIAFRDYE
jgi:DNA ligase-1